MWPLSANDNYQAITKNQKEERSEKKIKGVEKDKEVVR